MLRSACAAANRNRSAISPTAGVRAPFMSAPLSWPSAGTPSRRLTRRAPGTVGRTVSAIDAIRIPATSPSSPASPSFCTAALDSGRDCRAGSSMTVARPSVPAWISSRPGHR